MSQSLSGHCTTLPPKARASSSFLQSTVQQRKVSRRSRHGCRNCRLRKVKCDEGDRQQCRKCTLFGVVCNFKPGVPDMQLMQFSSTNVTILRDKPVLRAPVSDAIWTADASYSYQLNAKCQDFITRYLRQSLCNPDDSNMAHVNRGLFAVAFTHPYLMHASLAVALAYDHLINDSYGNGYSADTIFHLYRATSLFHERLKTPVSPTDKDAIWGTAAAISLLSFAMPEATTPEESWPLAPSNSSDLGWLNVGRGKMSLWNACNPLQPDSIFSIMAATYAQMETPLPDSGVRGIAPALAHACHLDEASTVESNPYFESAHALCSIQSIPDGETTVGHTEMFIRTIKDRFEMLLRQKDPVALLLLYLWYRKAGRNVWWIELRARVECPAIYMYLQHYPHLQGNVLTCLDWTPG